LPNRLAHFLACCLVFGLVGGAGYLTYEAWESDRHNPQFLAARENADKSRQRALTLASAGIPPEGAMYVLLRDPLTHGRAILDRKCLGCHYYDGKGTGEQTAPDLKDFGSYAWVRGLLEDPKSASTFGKVPQCDGMVEWKKSSKLSKPQLDDVARFVASFAEIPADQSPEEWLNSPGVADHPGLEPFQKECGTCHIIDGLTEGGTRDAPKLFAWGSPWWIGRMIHKPGAPDLYGYLEPKDRMPSFGSDQLTDNDVTTLTRYLKHDYPDSEAVSEAPSRTKVAAAPAP
jgi:ubiquinol-cytochrome c reductase cytochrome b subunit